MIVFNFQFKAKLKKDWQQLIKRETACFTVSAQG
jgi:hypothetical protein